MLATIKSSTVQNWEKFWFWIASEKSIHGFLSTLKLQFRWFFFVLCCLIIKGSFKSPENSIQDGNLECCCQCNILQSTIGTSSARTKWLDQRSIYNMVPIGAQAWHVSYSVINRTHISSVCTWRRCLLSACHLFWSFLLLLFRLLYSKEWKWLSRRLLLWNKNTKNINSVILR